MKIKINKHTGAVLFILIISIFVRFYQLDAVGYVTDEPVIITAGIKHFLNNPYPVSLYDMATPSGQWPIGLSITLLTNRDYSPIREFGKMDYSSIDINRPLLSGLEFPARLPSALMGVLSGIIVYYLVKEMYGKMSGLISYALFSFSPIIVDYSRIALLEIYQITYMLIALLFLYYGVTKKKKSNLHYSLTGVFLGLTAAAKLNGLMLIPLVIIFTTLMNFKKEGKNEASLDLVKTGKEVGIILLTSLLTLGVVFKFNPNVPFQIFKYYDYAGGAGVGFVLFKLLKDVFFFTNPLLWPILGLSIYYIKKDGLKQNDAFALFLLGLLIFSGFFEAHASIKRGVQYTCLLFIIAGRAYSSKNKTRTKNEYIYYLPIILVILNLALVTYYFPHTGLAKSVICTSQECLDNHKTRNYDSRLVGEYLNGLSNAVIYDPISTTGLTGFYTNKRYLAGGIAKLQLGKCPDFNTLKNNNITHVINNTGCLDEIIKELENCSYESINVHDYEMTEVYDIREC